ncbi:hypothetical protein [Flavobacterium gelatinilyticum]|uniref:hypothetical protein n=1 Tax=Flavobacterium gelatinilyticum TaxID=3003260 RepID=UPI00247FEE01|nr:hypothetical protein [Flavobacterium gelatinilyticum]
MQGIDNREHQSLLDVFQRYRSLSGGVKVDEAEDFKIYQSMTELDILYCSFKVLISELERCTKEYEQKKKMTRSIIHKNIRKVIRETR